MNMQRAETCTSDRIYDRNAFRNSVDHIRSVWYGVLWNSLRIWLFDSDRRAHPDDHDSATDHEKYTGSAQERSWKLQERSAWYGCHKWYMIRTILLPSAMPGILTGYFWQSVVLSVSLQRFCLQPAVALYFRKRRSVTWKDHGIRWNAYDPAVSVNGKSPVWCSIWHCACTSCDRILINMLARGMAKKLQVDKK